ncbi:MAG: hypothetical protein CUN55_21245, partial [Phototrophicales bacterium]
HCNDSVVAYHLDIHKVAKLAQQTRTPWLSLHLSFPYPRLDALWQRLGIPFPLISRKQAFARALQHIQRLKAVLNVPLLIENQAHYRRNGHSYLVEPTFLAQLLS